MTLAERFAVEVERPRVREEARAALFTSIRDELIPAWYGTPWDFYGTSATPGQGKIACGYFVSTILQHAGLGVERYKLAQQASAQIVESLAPKEQVRWRRDGDRAAVLATVAAGGDGLSVVGLDNHTGFLLHDGERFDFCHSSYLAPVAVVCEPAVTSAAFTSRVYVVGPLFSDALVDAWLTGRAVPTVHTPGF